MRLAHPGAAVRSVRPAPARRSRQGFSLLEMMVVVAIIGITAAIAGPAIGRSIASSRADRASHDIIRIGRRGRSESIAYGRAYLLRMNTTGSGGVELWRGRTSLCRQDWGAITGAGTCAPPAAPSGNCVDYAHSSMYESDPHTVTIAQVPAALVELCFTPDGDMVTRPAASTGAFSTPARGLVTITVLLSGPTGDDPLRGAVFPSAGAPRSLR